MKKIALVLMLVLLLAGCNQQASNQHLESAEFPERALEFVACYGPGGGHDTMLRAMTKVLSDEGIIDTTINVVNKPGGSVAVGMGYVNTHAGDGHYLMSVTSSFITTPLSSDIGVNYKKYTPIARLGIDPELILVNAKTEYKTLEDIIESDKVMNVGGTGQGTIEHIVSVKLADLSGKQLNYIPYQGDGEVVAALMGNQIDFTITNPNTAYDYLKSGDFRAIAISTEERIELLPDVPTFKELGFDIVISLFRGVVAPADISDKQKEYYEAKIKELVETDAWKEDYLAKNMIVEGYLNSEDFEVFLNEINGVYETTLKELKIIE